MIKKIFTIIACLLVFSQVAVASEPEVFKLDNGQTVVIQRVPESKLVCIDTWIKTGSINENDKNSGVAHFLEHLFFKGSKKYRQGEFEKILDGKGAIYNAATSKDFTHFYITIKKEDLPLALNLQSDMLLNPAIPQNEIDKERKVVLEEIARSKDSPNNIVFQNMNSLLFKKHPYKRDVIGTEDIIKNITRKEIFEFYDKWYTPSNMVTVIVGNIDKKEALGLVRASFNQPKGKICQNVYPKELSLKKLEKKIEKGKYNTAYLEMAFKGCEFKNTKDSYALDVLSVILGQGATSYLYKALKENKNLVTYVDSGHYSLRDDSIFYISLGLNSENYSLAENEVINQINLIRKNGVSLGEVQKAKNILERSYIYANESVESIANSIGYDMVLGGDLKYYSCYIDDVKKITEKDILRVANEYLDPNKMAVSLLVPEKAKVGMDEPEKEYSHLASRADVLVYNYKPNNVLPEVLETTTKEKAKLIVEKNKTADVVAVEIFIKGGDFLSNKVGLCDVLAKSLIRGTKDFSAQEISAQIENSGIILIPSSSPDYFHISLKSTKDDFDKAYGILKDVLNNATFPETEVKKAKGDILDEIKIQQDNPQAVAIEKFKSAIYPNTPYGVSLEDLKKAVPTITRSDVINYYNNYFIPENMIISVSGNINPSDVQEKFGDFVKKQGKIVDQKSFATSFKPLEKAEKFVTKKKTETTWVAVGQRVPSLSNEKDFAALKVINSVLSGGMSSRLFINLREKKGLAYEVGCTYPTLLNNSYFVLYIGTNPKNTELVQKEFQNEINNLLTKKLSEEELCLAKQRLIGYLALTQETNSQRATQRGRYIIFNKEYNFSDKYEKLVESISADDIIEVANKYFKQPFVISIVEPIEE
ncbi:MAG: pitrilysin family protein [bacterium]